MLPTMQVAQLPAEKAFIRDGCEACEVKTDYKRKNAFIIGIYEARAAAWRGSVLKYVTKPRKARNEVDAIRNAFLHVEAEVKMPLEMRFYTLKRK